jgi:hypothetical protein
MLFPCLHFGRTEELCAESRTNPLLTGSGAQNGVLPLVLTAGDSSLAMESVVLGKTHGEPRTPRSYDGVDCVGCGASSDSLRDAAGWRLAEIHVC